MRKQGGIAIVTRPTRLAGQRQRWGTPAQARFLLRRARAAEALRAVAAQPLEEQALRVELAEQAAVSEISNVEAEDQEYQETIRGLQRDLDFDLPVTLVDRAFLPNFEFENYQTVVVVGQDGLVANAAKYVAGLPIIGVNPDPAHIDGILLPFRPADARDAVERTLALRHRARQVTLAEAVLNDGQTLLAFNDFFVGAASHVSAKYMVEVNGQRESQSSSGLLVSTGAGSTGWLSSVVNMACGVSRFMGRELRGSVRLDWEERRLVWAVREPFLSKASQIGLVAGWIEDGHELVVESQMAEGGVIFSDGVPEDAIAFPTGTIARIGLSRQTANLVVP
jgi:NAD kinase